VPRLVLIEKALASKPLKLPYEMIDQFPLVALFQSVGFPLMVIVNRLVEFAVIVRPPLMLRRSQLLPALPLTAPKSQE
jgi:hypothetical protein